jgi:hypothetical protein
VNDTFSGYRWPGSVEKRDSGFASVPVPLDGTFQAVWNTAAEMAIATEGAPHLVYQALARPGAGRPARRSPASRRHGRVTAQRHRASR